MKPLEQQLPLRWRMVLLWQRMRWKVRRLWRVITRQEGGVGWGHEFTWVWRDRENRVKRAGVSYNLTALEGETLILDVFYRNASPPLTFYLGLTNALLGRTSTVNDAAQGEPTGNGYSRAEITRDSTGWPTLETFTYGGNSHKRLRSAQKTFTNTQPEGGQDWPAVSRSFLVARMNNSPIVEKLVSFADLEHGSLVLKPQDSITVEARPFLADPI